ncbi:MAG: Rid family detoxifying hydrolase [Candidatus Cloacimonetes bacterium]|nr:Rid family detoxifying hydrolase [Candidatus Cloacimonadota bacterium]
MKSIHAFNAPEALGAYSQAVIKNGLFFSAGQIGLNPLNQELPDSFNEQAENVMNNLHNILTAAGLTFGNVVKSTVYLKDMNNFDTFQEIYQRFFQKPYPARDTIEVSRLPKNAAIEISVIAIL